MHEFNEEMQAVKLARLQQPSTLLAQQLARKKAERAELLKASQEILSQVGIDQPAEISLWLKQWETQSAGGKAGSRISSHCWIRFSRNQSPQEELLEKKTQVAQKQKELHQLSRQKAEQRQRLELEVAASQKKRYVEPALSGRKRTAGKNRGIGSCLEQSTISCFGIVRFDD